MLTCASVGGVSRERASSTASAHVPPDETIMSNSWLFAFVGFRCSVTESPTKVSTGKLDET